MSSRKVLLLNRGESVLDVITWQTAVCLLVKGNAIAPWGYDHFYKIPVAPATAERMQFEGNFETSIEEEDGVQRGYFLLPTALVLVEYAHIPYRRAAVNKRNVLKRDKYTCGYCGVKLTETTGTIDHIVPQSRWEEFKKKGQVKGKYVNSWKNVVASCQKCNSKKDDKTLKECGMTLKITPFVPSRDYLIFKSVNLEDHQVWERFLCFDDLK